MKKRKSSLTKKMMSEYILMKNGETNYLRCRMDRESLEEMRSGYIVNFDKPEPKVRNWKNKKEMKAYKKLIKRAKK